MNVLLDFSPEYLFNFGPLKLDRRIIYPQLKILANSSFQILQSLTSHPAHQVILIDAVSWLCMLRLVHPDQKFFLFISYLVTDMLPAREVL